MIGLAFEKAGRWTSLSRPFEGGSRFGLTTTEEVFKFSRYTGTEGIEKALMHFDI
jgi:hypothetical protein